MDTLKVFVTRDAGDFGFKFPVGTDPSLCAAQAVLQAALLSFQGPLRFGSATNPLLVTLGS